MRSGMQMLAFGLLVVLTIALVGTGGRAAPAPAGLRVPLDADPTTLDPILVNDPLLMGYRPLVNVRVER